MVVLIHRLNMNIYVNLGIYKVCLHIFLIYLHNLI